MQRLASNGWTVHIITATLNEVRDWPSTHKKMLTRSTTHGRFVKAFKKLEPNAAGKWKETEYRARDPQPARVTDYSTGQFSITSATDITEDVNISSLYNKVKAFPKDDEAGVLTAAVLLVKANPELDCKLSELVNLASTYNIAVPSYTVQKEKDSLAKWKGIASRYNTKAFGDTPAKKKVKFVAQEGPEDQMDANDDAVEDADAEADSDVEDAVQDPFVGGQNGGFLGAGDSFGEMPSATTRYGNEDIEGQEPFYQEPGYFDIEGELARRFYELQGSENDFEGYEGPAYQQQ
jgi:hypothetical protein